MTITYANDMTIIHKGDGQQFIAMAPDVCKTPSPGGPVPVPYPNIAMSSDLAKGSKTVNVEGNPAAIKTSNLKISSGDEGGTAGGGIVSSKTKGKLTWLLYSTDVKFEGKGVIRFLDSNMHNGNAGNTGGKNKGKMSYPGGEGDILCENCGKPISDPSHKQLSSSSQSDKEAKKVKGRTKAAVVVHCPPKKPNAFTGVAGDMYHPFNPNTFKDLAKNFKSGKPIPPKAKTDSNNPAGNCAEQKALYSANAAGAFPPGPGCTASMSVMREKRSGGQIKVPSCETCKRVLTSMMCENEPSK